MTGFDGAVVALFESRRATELAKLVQRHGGAPYGVPSITEVPVPADAEHHRVLRRLATNYFDIVVLMTGTGVERLLEEARRVELSSDIGDSLRRTTTIARGAKPNRTLRAHGIVPRYVVPEPHTTAQIVTLLAEMPLSDRHVLIVTAGEATPAITTFLDAHRASTTELQLYRWELTSDARLRLEAAIGCIVRGEIRAIAFTTQIQVRYLFQVAESLGEVAHLRDALRAHVIVGAIGSTCADALRQCQVEPDVIPKQASMGQLVLALADRMATSRV